MYVFSMFELKVLKLNLINSWLWKSKYFGTKWTFYKFSFFSYRRHRVQIIFYLTKNINVKKGPSSVQTLRSKRVHQTYLLNNSHWLCIWHLWQRPNCVGFNFYHVAATPYLPFTNSEWIFFLVRAVWGDVLDVEKASRLCFS